MSQELVEAIRAGREDVRRLWATRVRQSSEHYRNLPFEEIERVSGAIVDGIIEALATGNYQPLEAIFQDLSERRTRQGFDITEVQRALMMGCETLLPVLERACGNDAQRLVWSVTQVERVMQRAAQLLNRSFEQAKAQATQCALKAALDESQAARQRLQALLLALDYAAIAVNSDLVVTWVDERAGSPQGGMFAAGDVHSCAMEASQQHCPLAMAFRTGEIQRPEVPAPCKVRMAVPVLTDSGQVAEVLALL